MNFRRIVITAAVAAAAAAALWSYRVFSRPAAVTPTLVSFSTGTTNGTWHSWALPMSPPSPPLTFLVLPLPAPGMGVQLILNAPHPSSFSVSAIDPTMTAAIELSRILAGEQAPPTGAYRIDGTDVVDGRNRWFLTVWPPGAFLTRPVTRYILNIKNLSDNPFVSGTAATSAPLLVTLDTEPNYTVMVTVVGPGHVTSMPSGINGCHINEMCRYAFGPYPVTLNANSDDPATTRFLGWTGNAVCPASNSCVVNPDGRPISVVANFGTSTLPADPCPAPPLINGWRWVTTPNCGRVLGAQRQCDVNGFFCCGATEGNSVPTARCGGQRETQATCATDPLGANNPVNQMLIQPGGCYETAGR